MANATKFRDRVPKKREGFKAPSGRSGDPKIPVIRMMDIQDGDNYRVRFFPPHPQNCESGWLHVIYHQIEPVEACPTKDRIMVLAKQCYEDEKNAPSYMDELLDTIGEAVKDCWDELPTGLQNALDLLQEKVRLLVPCLWWVNESFEDVTANNGIVYRNRKLTPNPSSLEPRGYIWEITAPGLIDKIFGMFEKQPMLNDMGMGSCFTFGKSRNTYSLVPEPNSTPFPTPQAHYVKEDYPKLDSWLAKYRKTNNQTYQAVKNAWFAPDLESLGDGIDLTP